MELRAQSWDCGRPGWPVDAILATPNQKTPVPQDHIFATAPGVEQAARTQSRYRLPRRVGAKLVEYIGARV
jgi:hypothetical protein